MGRTIKLTESQLNRIIQQVIEEESKKDSLQEQSLTTTPSSNPTTSNNIARGGTSTASAGAYVTPTALVLSQDDDDYPDPYEEDNPDPYDPYDPDDPNRYPKPGSYEAKLGRSPMCCKKCKNGKFKHQCDDDQKGGNMKYDSTNCVYETISDCQLNKRTSKKKKKSKK